MVMPNWTMVTTSYTVFNQVFASSSLFDQTYGIRRLGPTIVPDSPTGALVFRDSPHPNPIDGNGSLLIRVLTSGHVGHNYRAASTQRAWATGAITSRWYAAVSAAGGGFGFGYYCFANQLDLRTSGSAYLIGCSDNQFLGQGYTYDLFLSKITSGLIGYTSSTTLLTRVRNNQWPLNSAFNLRVTWVQSTSSIYFRVLTGSAADLSDMAEKFSYTDLAPLSITVAEGFWGASRDAENLKVYTDVTEFYKGIYP